MRLGTIDAVEGPTCSALAVLALLEGMQTGDLHIVGREEGGAIGITDISQTQALCFADVGCTTHGPAFEAFVSLGNAAGTKTHHHQNA